MKFLERNQRVRGYFMEIRSQERLAAKILKCGESRIWVDPARIGDVSQAITAYDIRKLILKGVIKKKQKTGIGTYRKKHIMKQKLKGRRRGKGSVKGKIGTRFSRKRSWINRIRSQRRMLKELRAANKIDGITYKILYRKSGGGFFRGRSHMSTYIEKTLGIKIAEEQQPSKA